MRGALKWPLVGLGLLCSTAGLFAGAHHLLVQKVEAAMNTAGLTWSGTSHEWLTLEWTGVQASIGRIERVAVDMKDRRLQIETVDVDLTAIQPPASTKTTDSSTPSQVETEIARTWGLESFQVDASDITVRIGDSPVFNARLQLTGGGADRWALLGSQKSGWTLHGSDLTLTALNQTLNGVDLRLTASSQPRVVASIPEFVLNYDILSTEPLPPQTLSLDATVAREGNAVRVAAEYGPVSASIDLTAAEDGVAATVNVPMTPMSDIAAVFGDRIPEAEQMEMNGRIGLIGTAAGPPWTWSAEPAVDGLSVSGGLPDALSDDQARFTAGDTVHVVGPAIDGWVPLGDAGWMPEAAIAAEDIRFQTHPGYDLIAIQEAITAAPDEERIRGGSTITQQLAKNLFLDGRRTLERKFRELLLALALEDRMSKDGILQLYLNVVEFGPNIRGIDEASRAWFMKDPAQLSPREAAFLAAILPAPNAWHTRITKTGKPPVTIVNRVLDRMRRKGVLSAEQHRRARSRRLRIVPP